MSGGLTCFPHGRGASTVDYLIGPLAFAPQIHDFVVPPPLLGVDHAYLAFHISATSPTPCATPILPRVRVHFDHVYVGHLTQGLASLEEEIDLKRAIDALTSMINDAAT